MNGKRSTPERASEAVETWHRNIASTRRGPPSSTALLNACRAVLVTCAYMTERCRGELEIAKGGGGREGCLDLCHEGAGGGLPRRSRGIGEGPVCLTHRSFSRIN